MAIIQSAGHTLATIAQRGSKDVKIQFRKGIKLAMSKTEIDKHISRLDDATIIIERLQHAVGPYDTWTQTLRPIR